jgi:hypothetical protein
VVAEDVAAFSLRYIGESGVRDSWDSTGVETDNLLPLNVEVMVQLWQHDAQGQLVPGTPVTRVMEIPTRPEFLEPPGGAGGGNCEDGISASECKQAWIAALEAINPEAAETYSNLFARVTDACWDPPQPSDELELLKKTLRTANVKAEVSKCPLD